jgi:hypothetical protein
MYRQKHTHLCIRDGVQTSINNKRTGWSIRKSSQTRSLNKQNWDSPNTGSYLPTSHPFYTETFSQEKWTHMLTYSLSEERVLVKNFVQVRQYLCRRRQQARLWVKTLVPTLQYGGPHQQHSADSVTFPYKYGFQILKI